MTWPREHKQSTRRRIVDAAAQAYRQLGLNGISTADIMRRAGLTHGGFYAHFDSKEALVNEAVALAGTEVGSGYAQTAGAAPANEKLLAIVESYLSSRHREHPESGCPIATLGSELAREGGTVRRKFGGGVRALLGSLSRSAPSADEARRLQQATGAFAAMVGGIILARALEDSNESDRLLANVREFVRGALAADILRGAAGH